MQKITPCLWYESNIEEAVNFYLSIFKNGKIIETQRYPKASEEVSGKKAGEVMTIEFEILGQRFLALNGGPIFKLSEAVSFIVDCKDQEEVDYYWGKLSEGGDPKSQVCGWLKDKFGLSWQIVPKQFNEIIKKHPEKNEQIMAAFMKMKKIDIAELEKAAE